MSLSPSQVINRINNTINPILTALNSNPPRPPTLTSPYRTKSHVTKSFSNISQCRGMTNCLLILCFVQKLLLSNRTTTNREVYYFFVTHFRSQRECDAAIVDVCNLVGVERISLGLTASPKGWFCGNLKIIRSNSSNVIDGTALSSIQGLPITREWIHRAAHIIQGSKRNADDVESLNSQSQCTDSDSDSAYTNTNKTNDNEHMSSMHLHSEAQFSVESDAKCIIVAEKEGVYTRLSEDRFFDAIPCILVTGKGFPDIATRALVFVLHRLLDIPVYGLADCNPYGLAVLQTYFMGGRKNEMDGGDKYRVPIEWIGLRPSQLKSGGANAHMTGSRNAKDEPGAGGKPRVFHRLPREVFQQLTDFDLKKMKHLEYETNEFMNMNETRSVELEIMRENGWKVELESLHWLGMGFMSQWLQDILIANQKGRSLRSVGGDGAMPSNEEEAEDSCWNDDGFDPRMAI